MSSEKSNKDSGAPAAPGAPVQSVPQPTIAPNAEVKEVQIVAETKTQVEKVGANGEDTKGTGDGRDNGPANESMEEDSGKEEEVENGDANGEDPKGAGAREANDEDPKGAGDLDSNGEDPKGAGDGQDNRPAKKSTEEDGVKEAEVANGDANGKGSKEAEVAKGDANGKGPKDAEVANGVANGQVPKDTGDGQGNGSENGGGKGNAEYWHAFTRGVERTILIPSWDPSNNILSYKQVHLADQK